MEQQERKKVEDKQQSAIENICEDNKTSQKTQEAKNEELKSNISEVKFE